MGAHTSKNQLPVAGRTVLLTGASSGLGLAAARQLAALGADVILASRDATRRAAALAEVRRSARDRTRQRFHAIAADVARAGYGAELVAAATAWNGGRAPDVVWCVAGQAAPGLWAEAASLAEARAQMDVNFWGSAELAHAVLRSWLAADADADADAEEEGRKAEPRHLIFTASVLALCPIAGYGAYTPAKAALRGLADTLVQELELYPRKVKVHIVYPGSIDSPGFERENRTKPRITQILEEGDPVQSPDAVAAAAIRGLEKGDYAITVAFLGNVLRWSALGGSPRNNWVVDGIMAGVVQLAWIFALPDIYRKITNFAKQHGHPASYGKQEGTIC